jgi:hypothetical protein
MEIKVSSKNPSRKELLEKASIFYAKELNLDFSTYTVNVMSHSNLRKNENSNGLCGRTGPKEITVLIDSRLGIPKILYTLAHEMTHVKQYVRGQYRSEPSRNGKHKRFWLGKQVAVAYARRPWEKEAIQMESLLVEKLLTNVTQNIK